METFQIEIIQFMQPDGKQVSMKTRLPIKYEPYYEGMLKNGCRFEAEYLLLTGEVSLTISNEEDGDIAIEIVPNGPEVQEALGKMLKERPWMHPIED